MKTFDAVIIGAGLAGLQCAKLLARQGAKILLVDRKTDLTKSIHTTGIFARKTLEDFDFPAARDYAKAKFTLINSDLAGFAARVFSIYFHYLQKTIL